MNHPSASCHNAQEHKHCIDEAMDTAQHRCKELGLRLTPLREDVLRLVWQSHKALGAYDILSLLAKQQDRDVAPPTIYRALDFLLQHRFIHQIKSQNAFVGCASPDIEHEGCFLLCRECHTTLEQDASALQAIISEQAQACGFAIEQSTLEILGLCKSCQALQDKEQEDV